MNALQCQRLNQLIDKLLTNKISPTEYQEYRSLWSSIGKEVIEHQRYLNSLKDHFNHHSTYFDS